MLTPQTLVSPLPRPANKHGVGAVTDGCTAPNCAQLAALGVSWVHTWWESVPVWALCPGVEPVPMIWGAVTFPPTGCPVLTPGSEWLLGFNEPELSVQSNLTPDEAAVLWRRVEACFPERKLVSPAVVVDMGWLPAMRAAYIALYGVPPRFDALGLHCYSVGGTVYARCVDSLTVYRGYVDAWGIPGGIWINEWAQWATPEELPLQLDQMRRMLALLDSDPYVYRHAMWTLTYGTDPQPWYIPDGKDNRLLDCTSHALTALGDVYATYEPRRVFLPLIQN